MTEEVNLLSEMYSALDEAATQVKPEFEKWITNTEVPLSTRWDLWVAAPTSLKNKERWVQHFYFKGVEISWFDSPMYAERRVEVALDDLVSSLENDEGLWFAQDLSTEEFDYYLNQLKEDILEKNLHSFVNDW